MRLDTVRRVATPEGVSIELHLAGPVPRMYAWLLDFAIRAVIYVGLLSTLFWWRGAGQGLFLVLAFLLEWFYPVVFEVLRHGQTPGKRAMGLAVVRDNGVPVDWTASLARNLLAVADFLPLFYGCGLLSMLVHREFRRLGDIAAGTVVIHRCAPQVGGDLPACIPRPVPLQLSLAEQQALVLFAARLPRLTGARAEELAAILARKQDRLPATVADLLAYAGYIAGER